MKLAVTFDFGWTLAEIDTAMLVRRLAERGARADADALEAAIPIARATYDAAIRAGAGGHPWHLLMRAILVEGSVETVDLEALVTWLWDEQPRQNLWRRPIAGMFELVRDLAREDVPLAIVSNSEGRLAELVGELGLDDAFSIVIDSGRFGVTKPDPRIFLHAAERLGVAPPDVVHVGDSYEADVAGAIGAGMRAVWFDGQGSEIPAASRPKVRAARGAEETRAALLGLGVDA